MQGARGHLYAVTGDKASGCEVLEKVKEIAINRYVAPFEFGSIDSALGMVDEAIEWFGRPAGIAPLNCSRTRWTGMRESYSRHLGDRVIRTS